VTCKVTKYEIPVLRYVTLVRVMCKITVHR